jgi:hypothetical protein
MVSGAAATVVSPAMMRRMFATVGRAALLLAAVVIAACGPSDPTATAASSAPSPTIPASVDGYKVMTVSEVLQARSGGGLSKATVAVGGYWSDGSVGHSCVPPEGKVGDLQYRCVDGEFGITERYEPIMIIDQFGYETVAVGPHMTPWIPNDLPGAQALFSLPFINGQRYRPVPIVVVGHFDDPRAADCAAEAAKLCADRLVVDRIAMFNPASVPTPGVSPTPTPFPSPAPSGLFAADACFGDVPLSFLGWTTTEALQMPFSREGHVWAAVTRDPVLLISDRWSTDSSGRTFRWWARRICISEEHQDATMEFAEVPGSTYKEYEDGTRTYATP